MLYRHSLYFCVDHFIILLSALLLSLLIPLYTNYITNFLFYFSSYFDGKKLAEDTTLENFKQNAYVLRPGFIYGTRVVPLPAFLGPILGPTLSLPLGIVGR